MLCVVDGLLVSADDSSLGVADKLKYFVSFVGSWKLGLNSFDGVTDIHSAEIQITIDFLNLTYCVAAEVSAAKTYRVNAGVADGLARGFYVWRNVFVDQCAALKHGMGSDVAELMDETSASDCCEVIYNDFAGELGGI